MWKVKLIAISKLSNRVPIIFIRLARLAVHISPFWIYHILHCTYLRARESLLFLNDWDSVLEVNDMGYLSLYPWLARQAISASDYICSLVYYEWITHIKGQAVCLRGNCGDQNSGISAMIAFYIEICQLKIKDVILSFTIIQLSCSYFVLKTPFT